jgi:hypothetical protein
MSKNREIQFKMNVTVRKWRESYGEMFEVTVEASGFTGQGEGSVLSYAFDLAYQDMTSRLVAGTNSE